MKGWQQQKPQVTSDNFKKLFSLCLVCDFEAKGEFDMMPGAT